MRPEISIVVPVYNVEPYIKMCLDSIINQSMKDFEALIIDDGSTDNSGKICDEYAAKDTRIKVIHKNNSGLSGARNLGITKAKGNYIMFIDPDDYVEKDFCLIPFNLAKENNLDIVMFNHYNVDSKGNLFCVKSNFEDGLLDKNTSINLIINYIGVVVWNKLFRKNLFNNVEFPVGFRYEDNATTYKLILKAEKIYYTNQELYFHRIKKDSISSTLNHPDFIKMYYEMYNDLKKCNFDFKVTYDILLVSLRYITYYGLNAELSKECMEIIDDFDSYKTINLRTRILLSIYKTNKSLFNFVCFLFCKRQHPDKFY